jgi:DNA-binding transcriptional MerR regulator
MPRPARSTAARHPIGVVAARTGLSVHVLRAWERRYGVVAPGRSGTGRRLYSDADITRFVLLARAARAGRSIAELAELDGAALTSLLADDADRGVAVPLPAQEWHRGAMAAVLEGDSAALRRILRRALVTLGAEPFLAGVLAPLLIEIGDEWREERLTISQEHAASGVAQQLLASLLGDLEAPATAPLVLLATTEGERHALGALMAAVVAGLEGWRVSWLGTDLPVREIALAAQREGSRAVGVSILATHRKPEARRALSALRAAIGPSTPLLLGGAGAARLGRIAGVTRVRDLGHWRSLLRSSVH